MLMRGSCCVHEICPCYHFIVQLILIHITIGPYQLVIYWTCHLHNIYKRLFKEFFKNLVNLKRKVYPFIYSFTIEYYKPEKDSSKSAKYQLRLE